MDKKNWVPVIALLLITNGASVFYAELQAVVDYARAPLFDGNQYLGIFEYFTGTSPEYSVSFPYNSRILVPFLASWVGEDPILAFRVINLIFTNFSVLLLFFLWQKLKIPPLLLFISFFWLIFHWTGLIRLNQFDPITVDLPLYTFQTLLIWITYLKRWELMVILAPIATIQKESFMGLLVALLGFYIVKHWPLKKIPEFLIWLAGALILSILTKVLVNYHFPPIETDKNSLITILFHLKLVLTDPFRLIRWITAIFVGYGAFLLIGLQSWAKIKESSFQQLMLVLSIVYLLYGIVAGGDMLRIVFLGFPFVMTLLLGLLRDLPAKSLAIALLLSFPLTKLRFMIPDPVSNWNNFMEWYPEYASPKMVLIWLGYGVICYFVLLFLPRFYSKNPA